MITGTPLVSGHHRYSVVLASLLFRVSVTTTLQSSSSLTLSD